MPTYDFECSNGHKFERFFRKISDGVATLPCPVCGAVSERRMSRGGGLIFKGSGFYITDYGKDGKKAQQTSAGADGASSSSSSEAGGSSSGAESAKGEAKPASSSSESSSASSTSSESKPAESKPSSPSTKSESKAPPPKRSDKSE